jgi:hypothetical protein
MQGKSLYICISYAASGMIFQDLMKVHISVFRVKIAASELLKKVT